MRLRAAPKLPENVRIVEDETGEVIPIECVYIGRRRREGHKLHVWHAVTPVHLPPGRWAVRIDCLPAHTAIEIVGDFGDA